MRYPIGIQTFEKIRAEGYVYVDKTRLIYELTQDFRYVFLSRPRRFGKSLLLSTIKSYFQGKRELFDGLDIARIESEWTEYPVIQIDLNTAIYDDINRLRERFDNDLSELERMYKIDDTSKSLPLRLENVIKAAYKQTGRRVVILIDEYDKPLLEAIGKTELQEAFRDELRGIYHNLLFMLFTFVSVRPIAERHTSDGSIDMVVETDRYVYVMGFKVDGSAQEAINQINSKCYTLPWAVDHRRVIKIGANFSTSERRLKDYIIQ